MSRRGAGALRGRRGWVATGVVSLLLLVALAVLGSTFAREPHGAPSSSYATNADGTAAWASLLARERRPVLQLRQSLAEASLDPRTTLVILEPESLLHSEAVRLLAFVRAGGRLLIGGRNSQDFLPALLSRPPEWVGSARAYAVPTAAAGGLAAGVRVVRSAGEGAWAHSGGYRPVLSSSGGEPLLLEMPLGRGSLLLLADASPLQNRLLAAADNAQLALNLAPASRAPLVFVEALHGYGESRGLAAVPKDWWALLGGLLLAGLLWALARGRRLGPPEREPAPGGLSGVPARALYVQALALVLRRAGTAQELAGARASLEQAASPSRLPDRG